MNVAQIIEAKRDGKELDAASIEQLISGYSDGSIEDYQMSAFAMAVYFQSMTEAETIALTKAMIDSGERLSWSSAKPTVDKHSTGGVGDKISIVLAPMLACCGVEVPMISGRGLGPTGGTLDKLESIQGYRTELSGDEFRSVVNWCGCSIASASAKLAPADLDRRQHFEQEDRRGGGCVGVGREVGQWRVHEDNRRCKTTGRHVGYRWKSAWRQNDR